MGDGTTVGVEVGDGTAVSVTIGIREGDGKVVGVLIGVELGDGIIAGVGVVVGMSPAGVGSSEQSVRVKATSMNPRTVRPHSLRDWA